MTIYQSFTGRPQHRRRRALTLALLHPEGPVMSAVLLVAAVVAAIAVVTA